MIVKVLTVKKKGSSVKAKIIIVDSSGNPIMEKEVWSDRGLFGSVANLMGDSVVKMAEGVAYKFRSYSL